MSPTVTTMEAMVFTSSTSWRCGGGGASPPHQLAKPRPLLFFIGFPLGGRHHLCATAVLGPLHLQFLAQPLGLLSGEFRLVSLGCRPRLDAPLDGHPDAVRDLNSGGSHPCLQVLSLRLCDLHTGLPGPRELNHSDLCCHVCTSLVECRWQGVALRWATWEPRRERGSLRV